MSSAKEVAGRAAAERVSDGMVLGLGTGSTVYFTLVRLAERIREEGLAVRGVPTSLDTEGKAREMGIPLASLEDVASIDLTIDGADEIDGDYQMIKGGGGALLREKVVASISKREIIVVGRAKVVERLGTTFRLPVEIAPFSRPVIAREMKRLGAEPHLRHTPGGDVFITDNGNEILDCAFETGIEDPRSLERHLALVPGVVESGLFIDLAQVLVIGDEDGTCEVREKD